jgi:beta-N-acetylhexosaminidase
MNSSPTSDEAKSRWIDSLLGRLSLEQKVGQLMVFGFAGPFVTPHVVELITKYHVGGLRIAQKFHGGSPEGRGNAGSVRRYYRPGINTYDRPLDVNTKRISCTPSEYAEVLNRLRDYALDRKDGIGLHFTYDQEGEGVDFLFGQRLFPYPMGLAASNDPGLAYRVALAAGRQARALGANMIHSPVLDVNTNPKNPEIGTRAYSDNPKIVEQYALQSLRGYGEAGIVSTGKHFPGRGESEQDAHFGLPVVGMEKKTFMETHVAPYRALIDAGLPAVMAAFTAYPCFGAGEVPGATAKEIITELLRGELGFSGVVTTDNIQMKGLLNKYELGEAAVRCLSAGCDILLFRCESPATTYLIERVIEAVRHGRYTERQLDESVRRILAMRWDMGLAENGGKADATKAGDPFNDSFVVSTVVEAAEKTVTVLRDDAKLLPISRDKKVLLIEQIHHFHSFINNLYSHPGMLWEEMRRLSESVGVVLIHETYTEEDKAAVAQRLADEDWDMIIATSYYNYRSHSIMVPFLKELKMLSKPIIVVSNTPYEAFGVPEEFPTAIVSFCPSGRENIRAVAETLFGALVPTGKIMARLK